MGTINRAVTPPSSETDPVAVPPTRNRPMHDTPSEWPARAEAVARDVLAKHAADVDKQARWPAESIDALKAGGFLGLTVPASHGGAGQGPRAFANVVAKLAEG